MLWYSVLLVALTVLPVCFGAFGMVYLGSALILGALFLKGALQVYAERVTGNWVRASWWLYKYSLLYLALLFLAMAVDRHL